MTFGGWEATGRELVQVIARVGVVDELAVNEWVLEFAADRDDGDLRTRPLGVTSPD